MSRDTNSRIIRKKLTKAVKESGVYNEIKVTKIKAIKKIREYLPISYQVYSKSVFGGKKLRCSRKFSGFLLFRSNIKYNSCCAFHVLSASEIFYCDKRNSCSGPS